MSQNIRKLSYHIFANNDVLYFIVFLVLWYFWFYFWFQKEHELQRLDTDQLLRLAKMSDPQEEKNYFRNQLLQPILTVRVPDTQGSQEVREVSWLSCENFNEVFIYIFIRTRSTLITFVTVCLSHLFS